jgi:gentisate 1,2-dioxygenase
MQTREYEFIDCVEARSARSKRIQPLVIPKAAIDVEIQRLANLAASQHGRASYVSNPLSGPGNGLTPGIAVSVCVLKPGEHTAPLRQNAALVNFCIGGAGYAVTDGERINFEKYDVWTTTPWSVYECYNNTDALQVCLTYSNSPLLEKLGVYVVDDSPESSGTHEVAHEQSAKETRSSPFGTFALGDSGAYLMPYEKLINPPNISMRSLHWPWKKVKEELDKLRALGNQYVGRRLYLMYDPATGRTNGTTNSFFATITIRPRDIVDKPHRHVSAAINYYFAGKGYSMVEGKRYDWGAGDLMLSAPGWAVHNHAAKDEDVYELTVQDQPMHIALGSLLWQEDLRAKPRLLGIESGFDTNRAQAAERVTR